MPMLTDTNVTHRAVAAYDDAGGSWIECAHHECDRTADSAHLFRKHIVVNEGQEPSGEDGVMWGTADMFSPVFPAAYYVAPSELHARGALDPHDVLVFRGPGPDAQWKVAR